VGYACRYYATCLFPDESEEKTSKESEEVSPPSKLKASSKGAERIQDM